MHLLVVQVFGTKTNKYVAELNTSSEETTCNQCDESKVCKYVIQQADVLIYVCEKFLFLNNMFKSVLNAAQYVSGNYLNSPKLIQERIDLRLVLKRKLNKHGLIGNRVLSGDVQM